MEGGELDFLALEALAGDLDGFALGFELRLQRGDAGAGFLVGLAEGGDFRFERADFVLPFQKGGGDTGSGAALDRAFG